jgi:hypothetical protein
MYTFCIPGRNPCGVFAALVRCRGKVYCSVGQRAAIGVKQYVAPGR